VEWQLACYRLTAARLNYWVLTFFYAYCWGALAYIYIYYTVKLNAYFWRPLIWAKNPVLYEIIYHIHTKINLYLVQLQTVDHSVRWSMKNAASCVKRCEMQDTPSTWFSNAYCSLRSFLGLRLSEGRYEIKFIIQVCSRVCRILCCCTRQTYSYTWPLIKTLVRSWQPLI
jgi:hypothetical protein